MVLAADGQDGGGLQIEKVGRTCSSCIVAFLLMSVIGEFCASRRGSIQDLSFGSEFLSGRRPRAS